MSNVHVADQVNDQLTIEVVTISRSDIKVQIHAHILVVWCGDYRARRRSACWATTGCALPFLHELPVSMTAPGTLL